MVSNCPRCQIVLGVKLSSLPSWCQIVLLAIMVSNCPKCQMVLGVKLSAVSNGPRILNIKSQLILFLSITGLGVSLARSEFAKSSDVWPPILFMALTKAHISSTSDSKIDHLW